MKLRLFRSATCFRNQLSSSFRVSTTKSMAFILSPESTVAATFAAFLVVLPLFYVLISRFGQKRAISRKKQAPEARGAWPLIGHLYLLQGPEPIHRILGTMADRYGPVFRMRMGMNQALVVSDWRIAKECFTTNDRAFASRPRTMAMELLGYDCTIITFIPYGSFWRQARKIATIELLSNHRLQKLKHVRESEVRAAMKRLYEKCQGNASGKVLIEMKHWIQVITLDIILRIIARKNHTSQEGPDWHRQIIDFFVLAGKMVVSDALPFLRWLDIGGYERSMKKTAKEFDIILQEWLDEHKAKRASAQIAGDDDEEDLMSVMLSLFDDDAELLQLYCDADNFIKATSLTLLLGAADTTSVTLTWAVALLLNHRDVLKKLQEEIAIHVGTERLPNESDMKNLVYLQAVIKETMRLYPAVPFLVPHKSTEDCVVSGYHVSAGTQLFVNAWKVHRDPAVWEEPLTFNPERFLTTQKDVDFKSQNVEWMPFGGGRRACPGISFGLQVMQLVLASVLHGFDFQSPSDEPVDMEEAASLVLGKAIPVQVLLTPRLSASVCNE